MIKESFISKTSADFTHAADILNLFKDSHSYLFIPPRFEDVESNQIEWNYSPINTTSPQIALYSSGSTGLPKAMANTKKKLLLNAELSIDIFGLNTQSNVLIVASPWHVAGLTWILAAQLAGAQVAFFVPYVSDLKKVPALINSMKATHLFTVPGALRMFYNEEWNVDEVIVGGASLVSEDYEALIRRTHFLTQAYGQTEAGGLISKIRKKIGSFTSNDIKNVGLTDKSMKIKINDNGSIYLLSLTAIENTWYDTGDIGYLDSENHLHITGRKKEIGGNCNALTGITMVAHK
ncbi:hypothetical protein EP331_09610 [bacterium]|nr:MAG: hypothetical protein EP331_09610 [bacterium]